MMMKKGFLLLGLIALAASNAMAEPAKQVGVYMGGNLGWTKWDDDNTLPDHLGIEDEDISWQINTGYKFNRHFAMDARYIDLGKYKVVDDTWDFSAWTINAVGIIPLSNSGFELFGNAGLGRADIDTKCCGRNNKDTAASLGLGGRYSLNRNLSLSAQLDGYYANYNDDFKNYIYAFTFGVQYIYE